jgi:hypothetical protein
MADLNSEQLELFDNTVKLFGYPAALRQLADSLEENRLKPPAIDYADLEARTGPMLTTDIVAERLGQTPQAITAAIRSGRLLAVRHGRRWVIPAQLLEHKAFLPGLPAILQALSGFDNWHQLYAIAWTNNAPSALSLLHLGRAADALAVVLQYRAAVTNQSARLTGLAALDEDLAAELRADQKAADRIKGIVSP